MSGNAMIPDSSEQPRVLYVTYVIPWRPRFGGALRCYGVIRGLAECSDLHVAFASSDLGAIEAFQSWPAPTNVTRHVLSPSPGWEMVDDRHASRTFRAAIGRGKYGSALRKLELEIQPDIVWYYEVGSLRRTSLPRFATTILDHIDVRWRKQMRFAKVEKGPRRQRSLLKAALLRIDDVQFALRVGHSLVASPNEVDLLWPAHTVSVVPNGYDFPATPPPKRPESQKLLFFGSLFYAPNADGVRWMCQEVWPLVLAQKPDAQLDIVGLGLEALPDLIQTPSVNFHGFVDDLNVMIEQAAALVVPLRVGGGTRIKILEAWAKGLPVVSTTIGAEGLAAEDGVTLLLGDTAEIFAAQCFDCLEDPDLQYRLAAAGYKHCRQMFDWQIVNSAISMVLDRCSQYSSP